MTGTLYIIDTMSQVYRAFYAIRELSTAGGIPTNAVFGFISMLNKLLRTYQPAYLLAATDTAAPTLRHQAYDQYKANRPDTPDSLLAQIPAIFDVLAAFHIPLLARDGFEADDLIATVALRAAAEGMDVRILSSDKDLFQLVGGRIRLLDTKADIEYGPDEVRQKLEVTPAQIVDYLSLTGDASDNVPGAPGIGPKTAASLLNRFGTLDACYERLAEITPERIREILATHRDRIMASRELVTLHTTVPLQYDWNDFRCQPPDYGRLRDLYLRLEFKSLLRDLPGLPPAPVATVPAPAPAASAPAAEMIDSAGAFHEAWLADRRRPVALHPLNSQTIAANLEGDGRIFVFRCRQEPDLLPALFQNGIVRALHFKPFYQLAKDLPAPRDGADASLLHYLLFPHIEDHGLAQIIRDVTGEIIDPAAGPSAGSAPGLLDSPGEIQGRILQYSNYLHRVCRPLEEKVLAGSLDKIYRDLELPLTPILVSLEQAGILLDAPFLHRLSAEMDERIHQIEDGIYLLAGEKFNLNSPKQLGYILFEKLGLPAGKKTQKTKSYSTGVEVLETLAMEYELPARLLDYRQLAKLKSTYVDALPRLISPSDGRLHTTFHQTVAATGRLSSANPNLQNIPVRTAEGQKIRRAFVAPPGWCLISADYSQIELRVMAHLSGDQKLLAAFQSGEDIHTRTALDAFGEKARQDPAEYRRRAKIINYSLLYGKTEFGLAQDMRISRFEARQIIDAYFAAFPGIPGWIEDNLRQAKEKGYVKTAYGRIRPMPELQSGNRMLAKAAERVATNAPVQGTAADIIKLAMIRMQQRLRTTGTQARQLLQVHDELVLECPEEQAGEVSRLVRASMEDIPGLSVPLVVDLHHGANWLEAK